MNHDYLLRRVIIKDRSYRFPLRLIQRPLIEGDFHLLKLDVLCVSCLGCRYSVWVPYRLDKGLVHQGDRALKCAANDMSTHLLSCGRRVLANRVHSRNLHICRNSAVERDARSAALDSNGTC
jgi:hypothetical protein